MEIDLEITTKIIKFQTHHHFEKFHAWNLFFTLCEMICENLCHLLFVIAKDWGNTIPVTRGMAEVWCSHSRKYYRCLGVGDNVATPHVLVWVGLQGMLFRECTDEEEFV